MDEKKTDQVVTRFPPSPTGPLHIGGARTALFNWLFSRHNKGRFIFRIEDTDRTRSTDENTKSVIDAMEWLGLHWDEGPLFQSERQGIYKQFTEKLLFSGNAYYCHCSPEELKRKRLEARERGEKPRYDRKCRDLGLGWAPGAVVRLKSPLTGTTRFRDLVKGPVSIENDQLDDLILQRSDGSATYHMAVVADDITLGVTHVIRGDDHINNTPRQILIYEGLGENVPEYAHLPMILGPDRSPLSKRHGAASVLEYKEMGFLPQALLSSLARLGWSYGDQEKFTIKELVDKFSLENVGKSAGIFNGEKLLDLNAKLIREEDDERLAGYLIPFIADLGCTGLQKHKVIEAVRTLKERSKTLQEMAEGALFYFKEILYDNKADEKFLRPEILGDLKELLSDLSKAEKFDHKGLEDLFSEFLQRKQIKLGKVAQPVRVALTGKTVSPGIFEIMEVLGREEVTKRLSRAVTHIENKM